MRLSDYFFFDASFVIQVKKGTQQPVSEFQSSDKSDSEYKMGRQTDTNPSFLHNVGAPKGGDSKGAAPPAQSKRHSSVAPSRAGSVSLHSQSSFLVGKLNLVELHCNFVCSIG